MATNFVQDGDILLYSNTGSAIASGDVVPMSSRCGIALSDIAATSGTGACSLCGVYSVPKATGQTWTAGQAIFWDSGAGKATTTATANTPMGFAFADATSGATSGNVELSGKFSNAEAAVQAALGGTLTGTVDGTLADVAAVAISSAGGNTYADTTVNTAVNVAVTSVNLQLKEIQTVVNAILTKLKAAGLMASS